MTQSSDNQPAGPPSVFDELLVILAQNGDRRAFERLYHRWQHRVGRAALRYTGDADSARDLSQDCWMAIWKGLGRLRDPRAFRAYVFGVLHRRGADYVRAAIRTRASSAAANPSAVIDQSAEPAEPARQGDSSALAQAFAKLPPDQRLAAHLHFVEGLTLSEIAAAQSIPTGTAKSRLFHARRKLKAALTETQDGDQP